MKDVLFACLVGLATINMFTVIFLYNELYATIELIRKGEVKPIHLLLIFLLPAIVLTRFLIWIIGICVKKQK